MQRLLQLRASSVATLRREQEPWGRADGAAPYERTNGPHAGMPSSTEQQASTCESRLAYPEVSQQSLCHPISQRAGPNWHFRGRDFLHWRAIRASGYDIGQLATNVKPTDGPFVAEVLVLRGAPKQSPSCMVHVT